MSAPGRSVRRTIVGRRMPMGSLEDELLPRWIALPIFASDPLSSVAYATEAALVVLLATSVESRGLIVPISAVISVLLAVVWVSYTVLSIFLINALLTDWPEFLHRDGSHLGPW